MARSRAGGNRDLQEDLEQAAYVEILRGRIRYDPSRGAWPDYARRLARDGMARCLAGERRNRTQSTDDPHVNLRNSLRLCVVAQTGTDVLTRRLELKLSDGMMSELCTLADKHERGVQDIIRAMVKQCLEVLG